MVGDHLRRSSRVSGMVGDHVVDVQLEGDEGVDSPAALLHLPKHDACTQSMKKRSVSILTSIRMKQTFIMIVMMRKM